MSKITTIPNKVNADIISEYHQYMCGSGASEHHQDNALKAAIGYAKFLGENTTFYDINPKEQITAYLDTKMNSAEQDPDKKWIMTWNDKLHRIKHLFRWLYNPRCKEVFEKLLYVETKIIKSCQDQEGRPENGN